MLEDFINEVEIVDDDFEINLPLATEYAWDFDKDEYIVKNGDMQIVTGNDAIEVWCYFALKTDRYVHEIYSWNYGSEMYALIGQKYSRELTQSEAKRYITEALLINRYILDVDVRSIDFKGSRVYLEIYITTVYGGKELKFIV